jgi:hypothetical protein
MFAKQVGQAIGFFHKMGQANAIDEAERSTGVGWETHAQNSAYIAICRR